MKDNDKGSTHNTLTLLWLFAILNILFRDMHELAKASAINEILSGTMNGSSVTDGALLAGAFAVEIILLAMLLPSLHVPRLARILNLVAPPLTIAGMFLIPPGDPDDHFFVAVVVATMVAIFVLAWKWRPAMHMDQRNGARNVV